MKRKSDTHNLDLVSIVYWYFIVYVHKTVVQLRLLAIWQLNLSHGNIAMIVQQKESFAAPNFTSTNSLEKKAHLIENF